MSSLCIQCSGTGCYLFWIKELVTSGLQDHVCFLNTFPLSNDIACMIQRETPRNLIDHGVMVFNTARFGVAVVSLQVQG